MTLKKELKVKTYHRVQTKVQVPLLCRAGALFSFPKHIHSLPLIPRLIVIAGPAADFLLRPNLNLKMDKGCP